MPYRQFLPPFAFAFLALTADLVAAPSAVRADTHASSTLGAPLAQATVSKTINAVAVELRDGYVFPDKGAQAADVLEKALVDGTYAGVTDPVQFA